MASRAASRARSVDRRVEPAARHPAGPRRNGSRRARRCGAPLGRCRERTRRWRWSSSRRPRCWKLTGDGAAVADARGVRGGVAASDGAPTAAQAVITPRSELSILRQTAFRKAGHPALIIFGPKRRGTTCAHFWRHAHWPTLGSVRPSAELLPAGGAGRGRSHDDRPARPRPAQNSPWPCDWKVSP
jgi:hypothetical protein